MTPKFKDINWYLLSFWGGIDFLIRGKNLPTVNPAQFPTNTQNKNVLKQDIVSLECSDCPASVKRYSSIIF
jgi:hypothetical protein